MEQDRIHIKLARRTPEERQADETRRLDPFMRALKAIHTAATPETMNVEDLEKQRKGQELLGRLVAPMAGMSWEPFELDGMNCAWARPPSTRTSRSAASRRRWRWPSGWAIPRMSKRCRPVWVPATCSAPS